MQFKVLESIYRVLRVKLWNFGEGQAGDRKGVVNKQLVWLTKSLNRNLFKQKKLIISTGGDKS